MSQPDDEMKRENPDKGAKMRLLFVLENYYPHIGGVEVVFMNLCEGLAARGHDVTVVTHRPKGTKKQESRNGVNIHRVSCIGSRYLFTFFSIPSVIQRSRKADIIHTTTFNAAPPAWLCARLSGRPVVITVHEVWAGKWGTLTGLGTFSARMHSLLERMLLALPYDMYICVSKSTASQLKSLKGEKAEKKARVIYNGVDYRHFSPERHRAAARAIRKGLEIESKFVCMAYGRPGVSKGIEYAIRAFPKILDKIRDARLMLIMSTDPAYQKRYRMMLGLIGELGIEEKVIVLKPKPWKELPGYILASDCVIVPSLAEGFGFTAAEACAMGRPVVASDTTSLPEVVSGVHVLVKPKDPGAIAEGVVRVREGKAEKSRLRKFLWDDNIRKTEALYRELAGKEPNESFIKQSKSL